MRLRYPIAGSVAVIVVLVAGAFFVHLGAYMQVGTSEPVLADVIVALGGDSGDRIKTTAALYQGGLAPMVLLTGLEGSPAETRKSYFDWRMNYLVEHGVGRDSILLDYISENSWEEANNTLKLAIGRKWQRVLVVSDPPHIRRLKWVWGRVYQGSGVEYRLISSTPGWWDAERWWQNEKATQFVLSEVIKIGYYWAAH